MTHLGPLEWWTADYEDAEQWDGPYASREEAEVEGAANEHKWITPARKALCGAADLIPDSYRYLDSWIDGPGEELVGPDGETPFEDWTQADLLSLEKWLRMAAAQWMEARGMKPVQSFMFAWTGPAEPNLRYEAPAGEPS